jgi:zinc protease
MKTILIYLQFFLVAILAAQEIPSLETFTLKNGLKVYFMKYGKIEAVNVKLMINSGKKNEVPGQQGYSNLTSDLILEGNKKYTKSQQDDKSFAIGATISSLSNNDYTIIEGNFLSKHLDEVMDLYSAAILQPMFDKDIIERYKNYLIENNQPNKMDIALLADVFSDYSIFGLENPLGRFYFRKQIEAITPEKIKEYYAFNYTPKNARLVITGNVSSEVIKASIEKYFGSWTSQYGEVNGVALDMPQIKKKEVGFINRNNATQCALQWNKIGPAINDKDALAFRIANSIFREVLFEEIREKGGKTYSIGSVLSNSKYANIISVACSVRSGELLSTVQLFDKTLANFWAIPPTKEQFETAITSFKTQLLGMESPQSISGTYNPVIYDFEKRKQMVNDLNALKQEDVLKAVKKYFTPEVYKLLIAGDEMKVKEQLNGIKGLVYHKHNDIETKN